MVYDGWYADGTSGTAYTASAIYTIDGSSDIAVWSPPLAREKTNVEWLDERVNEYRVKL